MTPDILQTLSTGGSYDLLFLAGVFVTGLLFGLTVCSFSCIPIVCTVVMGTRRGFKSGFKSTVTFAAGRTAGYTIAGMLCGLTGMAAEALFQQKHIYMVAGLLFLLTGVFVAFFTGKKKCENSRRNFSETENPKLQLTALGIIIGMMPCAPYLAIMAGAAASGSVIKGGLLAFFFGLGTSVSPLLFIGGGAGWFAKKILEKITDMDGFIRKVNGFIIIMMGIRMFGVQG